MLAIHTRYLAPTNFRGARIVATVDAHDGRLVASYPYDDRQPHRTAAEALLAKVGWQDHYQKPLRLFSGQLPDGSWAHIPMAAEDEP